MRLSIHNPEDVGAAVRRPEPRIPPKGRWNRSRPVDASQTGTPSPSPPAANNLPSGEKATSKTRSSDPITEHES